MIEYVHPTSLDERVMRRAAGLLAKGSLAAIPTDTSWSVVCALNSKDGLSRLKKLASAKDERTFTLLCSEISQASSFCAIDNKCFRLMKRLSPGPYVFVLRALSSAAKTLGLRRSEIGVRIPASPVSLALIAASGGPLYSVTAKRAMAEEESENSGMEFIPEEALYTSAWELDEISGLDLVLDTGEDQERILSTVLDLTEDDPRLLRAGVGEWPL